jgi:hypothetical protein
MLSSRLLVVTILVLVGSFADAQCNSECSSSNPSCCCIVDTYKTIPAHYNGADIDTDTGCYGVGTYGSQYECPEYVLRFYATEAGVDTSSQSWMNWWVKASGIDFYTNASQLGLVPNPNCIAGSGPGQPIQGCSQNTMPQADDIISFCVVSPKTGECEPKKENAGHVAVVKGSPTVNGTTFAVTLIEQNWSKYANGTPNNPALSGIQNADGTYTILDRRGKCEQLSPLMPGTLPTCVVYSYLRIQGWLRLPPVAPTWTHFTPSGIGPTLNGNPPVYDPGSNRLIMYGGLLADNSCCTSDTWVLMNANGLGGMPQWQQLSPAGSLPPTRVGHSAVYDATNNRMIIFGGGQQGGCGVYCVLFNDVWVLSNANGVAGPPTWRQLIPSAPNGYPAPRAAHLAIYDPTTNRVIIFGGGNNGTGDRNDTWVLTNANGLGGTPEWVPLSPAGSLPAPREIAVGSYDPIVSAMTLFGGVPGFLGDLWILSRANGLGGAPAWQQISQTSPSPGTLANWNYGYDSATNTLLFFGGSPSYGVFRNDFWILRNANGVGAPTWINTIPANSPGSPPPSVPLGTYDAIHNRFMIVPDAADLWVLTKANDSQ